VLQPLSDFPQGLRVKMIETMASIALFSNQAGLAQKAKVLRDRGAGDGKGAGDLARWLAAASEKVEDGPPRGVRKGAEHAVGRMSNRTVSHNT
jgi:hypothetical protein